MSARVEHLEELARVATRAAAKLAEPVGRYVALVRETLAAGRTVFFAGNGGSAAHAQHVATEYVVRFRPRERRAAPALALSTDSSLLTAAANDLGFDRIFARQVEAHGRRGRRTSSSSSRYGECSYAPPVRAGFAYGRRARCRWPKSADRSPRPESVLRIPD